MGKPLSKIIFRGFFIGTATGCLPLAYAWTGGFHNDILNIVALLVLFGLGVPWNLGIFVALLGGGQWLLSSIPMPFLGHTAPEWEAFGKAIYISVIAGAFINGFFFSWLRYSRSSQPEKYRSGSDAKA